MTVIARGATQVANIERALGGRPPRTAEQRSRSELRRYVIESSKAQRQARAESAKLAESARELALGHIDKDDPRLKRYLAATKAVHERRGKHKLRGPKREEFEPSITIGSIQAVKAAPYDTQWISGSSDPNDPNHSIANEVTGTLDLGASSSGDGYRRFAAGLGMWFLAPADNSQQRVAALLDFNYWFFDGADLYVAHSDLRTRLWVWGPVEGSWVLRQDVSPNRSDGASWFEQHENTPGEDGRISVEAFFPCRANRWYLLWVWADVSVYADGGTWGNGSAREIFTATVPFVVFGGL